MKITSTHNPNTFALYILYMTNDCSAGEGLTDVLSGVIAGSFGLAYQLLHIGHCVCFPEFGCW